MIISQEPEVIAAALELQARCSLSRVVLRASHASTEHPLTELQGPFSLRISHSSTANAIVNQVLRIEVRFQFQSYDSSEVPVLQFGVESSFGLDYKIEEDEFCPSEESILAFKDGNAVFNCWPYAREFVQSMAARMDLNPPPLPLLRMVPRAKTEEP